MTKKIVKQFLLDTQIVMATDSFDTKYNYKYVNVL